MRRLWLVLCLSTLAAPAYADMERNVKSAREIICNSVITIIKMNDVPGIRGATQIIHDDWAATSDHDMTDAEMVSVLLYCSAHREMTLDSAIEVLAK